MKGDFRNVGRHDGYANRNLHDVADHLWSRVLSGWRGVSAAMADDYDLTEIQVKKVKDYVRDRAVAFGVTWGYLPSANVFMLIDNDRPDLAKQVKEYGISQWKYSGNACEKTYEMEYKQGFVSAEDLQGIRLINKAFKAMLPEVAG